MPTQPAAAQIAAAIGPLLLRPARAQLYGQLTDGVDGVDEVTYPVLSCLARTGPSTASRLAEQIGLDRTVTTRHATRLERAGLIARGPDPADARGTLLHLTSPGDQAVRVMRARLEQIIGAALDGWTPQRAATFADDLRLLVAALLPQI